MKLEWEENKPKNLIKNPMTWDEAVEYAKTLGEGWRLPTRSELIEAYDNKVEGFKSDGYWSSSTYGQSIIIAWYVDFNYGFVPYNFKASTYWVRCVRER